MTPLPMPGDALQNSLGSAQGRASISRKGNCCDNARGKKIGDILIFPTRGGPFVSSHLYTLRSSLTLCFAANR